MRFSELDGAAVGVWGVGRETRSFAAQLAARLPSARIAVVASDDPADRLGEVQASAPAVEELGRCDVVVRSPGVSIYRDELLELRRRGVRVTTATGLWLAETGGVGVIGVTGTKGKSTTAALIRHLARAGGRDAVVAGNIGVPALDLLDRAEGTVAVVELSSYQIADLEVGPAVVVITNVYREHTDWHGSHEAYRADKLRILGLPGVQRSVLNGRDAVVAAAAGAAPEPVLYGVPGSWDVGAAGVSLRGETVVGWSELGLRGPHNALNLCAALCGLEAFGVPLPELPGGLAGFAGLPHRLEVVAEGGGLVWVDDSISTTPESALAALASFADRAVVLVAGGADRGQDFGALGRELARTGSAVVGLPVTGPRVVEAALAAGLPAASAVEAQDMVGAVSAARELAPAEGAVVVLSPAAPSFNAYRDFEERGEHFARLARE